MISFFDKFKGRGPLNHSLASRSDSNYEGESKSVLCKPRKHTGGGCKHCVTHCIRYYMKRVGLVTQSV